MHFLLLVKIRADFPKSFTIRFAFQFSLLSFLSFLKPSLVQHTQALCTAQSSQLTFLEANMLATHIIALSANLLPHTQIASQRLYPKGTACKRTNNPPEVMSWLIPWTEITAPAMPLLFSSDTIPLMPW